MFNVSLLCDIRNSILFDISWRCLKTLIADLKDIVANN